MTLLPASQRIHHWSDDIRDPNAGVFEIRDSPGPTFTAPPRKLPKILVGPETAADLEKRIEPIAQQILATGLGFDRPKLESIRDRAIEQTQELSRRLPSGDLVKRYNGWGSRPLGAVAIQSESQIWRAALDEPQHEIALALDRLRHKRTAALATNALGALDESGRLKGAALIASATTGAFSEFSPQVLHFADLLGALTAPPGRTLLVVTLPDLALRALSFCTGDARLRTILSGDDPWGAVAISPAARTDAREITSALIFGDGQPAACEWFGRLRLNPAIEPYERWLKSCGGFWQWLAQITDSTGDSEMKGSSYYSTPNQRRADESRETLLRENGLAAHRLAGLAIAAALASGGAKTAPPENSPPVPHRGPGRPPKNTGYKMEPVIPLEPPQLLASVGDNFLIEAPSEIADQLGSGLQERLQQFFAEHFPSFALTVETQTLKETK
jgi:hypothetical protein